MKATDIFSTDVQRNETTGRSVVKQSGGLMLLTAYPLALNEEH